MSSNRQLERVEEKVVIAEVAGVGDADSASYQNGSTFTLAATTWALYNNSRETALNNKDHLNTMYALLREREIEPCYDRYRCDMTNSARDVVRSVKGRKLSAGEKPMDMAWQYVVY